MTKIDYINILIKLEPVFIRAGEMALKLRGTAATRKKYQTGIIGVDIVTEADLAVQEALLSEMAKTELIECELDAEEDTPSVVKFKGTNGLVLTLDPIDGTIIYASSGRFFSIIVCLHDKNSYLYTFCHYPAANWTRRIAHGEVTDFGELPKVKVKSGLDLSRTIGHTYRNPQKTAPDIYSKLTAEGYVFRSSMPEITDESGSCTLFFLGQIAGYYTDNPGTYDGLCALHYAQVKNFKIYSTVNIKNHLNGPHGHYYPGWYVVLRK